MTALANSCYEIACIAHASLKLRSRSINQIILKINLLQINKKKLPKYLLRLKHGDVIAFVRAEAGVSANAASGRVHSYGHRTQGELEEFFRESAKLLGTSLATKVVLWHILGGGFGGISIW